MLGQCLLLNALVQCRLVTEITQRVSVHLRSALHIQMIHAQNKDMVPARVYLSIWLCHQLITLGAFRIAVPFIQRWNRFFFVFFISSSSYLSLLTPRVFFIFWINLKFHITTRCSRTFYSLVPLPTQAVLGKVVVAEIF